MKDRALVYHTGALGDFITCLPAIKKFRSVTQCSTLLLAGRDPIRKFAETCTFIDESIDVVHPDYSSLFSESSNREKELFFRDFGSAIIFTSDQFLIRAAQACGLDFFYSQKPFPESNNVIHIVEYHLSLFGTPVDLEDVDYGVTLPFNSSEYSCRVINPGSSYVTMSPKSGSRKKNWPLENFVEIARMLEGKGVETVWILGPDEEGLLPEAKHVCRNRSLPEVGAVLKEGMLHIGNDSGISHFAASLKTPVLSLFGASDCRVWSPFGLKTVVVTANLPCSPCHMQKGERYCTNECMRSVTVAEVYEQTDKMLGWV